MMKNILKASLTFLAFLIVCASLYTYSLWKEYVPESYMTETVTGTSSRTISTVDTVTGTKTPGGKTFTLKDVQEHATEASCYTIINNVIYDLTLWVHAHPGGSESILSMCGTDGTASFMDEHKGRAKFMNILARFKTGLLL